VATYSDGDISLLCSYLNRVHCRQFSRVPHALIRTRDAAQAQSVQTEAAYQRGAMLEKRRRLMDAWAEFCAKPASAGTIVNLTTCLVHYRADFGGSNCGPSESLARLACESLAPTRFVPPKAR
jgi:hypothetical protein